MNKLPVISGLECIRALEKEGFYVKRQKGSHIVLRRDKPFAQLVVPEHKKLDRGTTIRVGGLLVYFFTKGRNCNMPFLETWVHVAQRAVPRLWHGK